MQAYKELIQQRDELDKKIAEALKVEKTKAIEQASQIINDFRLTEREVFGKRKPYKKARAKYRNPETGAMWSGRGREPLWIKGKDREDFAIKVES